MPFMIPPVDKILRARLLAIEPKGQELELWCWAACGEMVVSYLRRGLIDAFPNLPRVVDDRDIRQGQQANSRRALRAAAAKRAGGGAPGAGSEQDCVDLTAREYEACNETGWPSFSEFDGLAQSTQWSSHRFALEQLGVPLRDHGVPRIVGRRLSSSELRRTVFGNGPEFARRVLEKEDCALSWPMLKSLIDEELPVIFSWRYPRGGHLMVAAGYVVTRDERWVLVLDPIPPNHGDWYLVPYEHYVAGPNGRHWRDYWVPRPAADGALPPAFSIDGLAVGSQLVRSSLRPAKNEMAPKKQTDGAWLTRKEEKEVRALADKGLATLRSIASQSPELATTLGMGGSGMRLLLKAFLRGYLEAEGKPELAAAIGTELKGVKVEPENLVLDEKYIPVFVLWTKDLKDWDGENADDLLKKAPRQVIFQVTRRDLEIYDFFSTITVQRYEQGWRLTSIGRGYLSSALAIGDLFTVLGGVGGFSIAGFAEHLQSLDLLEAAAGLIPRDLLVSFGEETALKPAEKQLLGELSEILARETPDRSAALLALAARADDMLKLGAAPAEPEGEGLIGRPRKPEFAVDVAETYQLFLSYDKDWDQLEPVYPSGFFPPARRVAAGDSTSVLRQLKKLAE
ncbi:MAG: hypothetical protein OES32_16960 [Acidobacteriota bacterium]|nr:hypothetical protein [Acidobacteriota bacterium]